LPALQSRSPPRGSCRRAPSAHRQRWRRRGAPERTGFPQRRRGSRSSRGRPVREEPGVQRKHHCPRTRPVEHRGRGRGAGAGDSPRDLDRPPCLMGGVRRTGSELGGSGPPGPAAVHQALGHTATPPPPPRPRQRPPPKAPARRPGERSIRQHGPRPPPGSLLADLIGHRSALRDR
jgi:hypothetical protein